MRDIEMPTSSPHGTFRHQATNPHMRQNSYPPLTPAALSLASPSVSSPSMPNKRSMPADGPSRQPSVDAGSVAGDNGKKKRISLSCAQCAKRKQKCNREFPCQHCLARKVPELCVPYNPQSSRHSDGGPDPQTAHRLERLEDVISVVVRHHGGLWGYKDVKEWMEDGPFQRKFPTGESSPSSPRRKGMALASIPHDHTMPGASGVADRVWQPRDGREGSTHTEDHMGKGWLGDLEGGVPQNLDANERVNIQVDFHGTPAENLQRLITDCGVSPHKVAELVQELPPKAFADRILDWFFAKINYIRYPIDERLFRASYEDLYNPSTSLNPTNVRALPLVFIVLATAVRLAPEEWAGDEQTRKLSSLRMYWSSRRSILIATAVQSESLELVLTRLLSAMYLVLIHDRRLTECWSQLGASLRTAQAIGLHRDGSKLGLDPFQTEYRRRIWSYLYHADKLYSLVLGRPPSISDSYTDTLPPSNVELSDLAPYPNPSIPTPTPKPIDEPTTATYLILRKSLAQIIGRIVHHFQKLDEPAQYSDVERLQMELDEFVGKLPRCFRMHNPDKSLDALMPWLPVHRFMLLTEILVTSIMLHRPWLLRKLSSNRYAASRTACFEAAKLDFALRQDFQSEVPDFGIVPMTGQFKMFSAAMIAGISAIIDPRGTDSDQMRLILTTYLEQNPWSSVKNKDETTRKEVQIIHTLSRRAAQIYEDTAGPHDLKPHDKDSVNLLLALSQTGDAQQFPRNASSPNTPGFAQSGVRHTMPHLGRVPWPPLASAASKQQSPASTGSEDDHSQRLLDHWLNANTALAVAGPSLDPSGVSYMPLAHPPNAYPPTAASLATFLPPVHPLGSWTDELGGYAMTQTNQFTGTLATLESGGGALGMGGLPSNNGEITGEGSDEYWNTLIDGILGTTGVVQTPAA
ncbi:fungal-specific transcription factor domain-domain-containing protein [Naematelia encephala]|uniref:Fungal-specific transcription factor domain-domain-containing protein n=1 Tax=Naematelia encephala TaxID=71784 RepID=A0A1Y2AYW5_9TREE|nr:fungal-specific transcription factor domain-domain-containing protein [Naematelia encephala]